MSMKILHPGLMATIQDLGRYGSQKYGVIVSGAMDIVSLRIANRLVGNDEKEAGIEITLYGTKIEFQEDHLIAITGGDLQATIDGNPVAMWRPIFIQKGSILHFTSAIKGCRAYLAIAGGLAIPEKMGSRSTYLRAKIGGYEGRTLQKDDVLQTRDISKTNEMFIKKMQSLTEPLSWSVNYSAFFSFKKTQTIRILPGSEYERFDTNSQQHFLQKSYTVTMNADRMGYQLKGNKLQLTEEFNLLSEGVTFGTIQVPTNGQPIILMADRQTTGGYPKIAQVISADLPKLAQMQPTNQILFELTSIEKAEQALLKRERKLYELSIGIRLKTL